MKDTINSDEAKNWTLLSNYAHVLICLASHPSIRLRDVAMGVGITERAVSRIVSKLEEGGIVSRQRDGRRNRYLIHDDKPLRHPLESHCTVGSLLEAVSSPAGK